MPTSAAAMELKVLISILQDGNALKTLMTDAKALTAALTGLQNQAQRGAVPAHIDKIGEAGKKAGKEMSALDQIMGKMVGTIRLLAGGFLAFESVRFIKDLADTAARAEVLATVLHVVGFNAGYSVEQLDKADRQIQALGITAASSRKALTQFIQAQLDLTKAPELARAAQDAAVILGVDSSEAFSRLVTAVQTSNTLMLRHMGIIVQSEVAYSKYAQSIGKTAGELTTLERNQAFLNATLEQSKKIQGSYTAAMGDVGKQLTSLTRYTEELKESLGKGLLPAYLAIVEELTLFLREMKLASDSMYEQGEGARRLGNEVRGAAQALHGAASFIMEFRLAFEVVLTTWAALRYLIVPLIAQIVQLGRAMGGATAEGTGLVGLFQKLRGLIGFFPAWMVILATVLTALMIWSDRFKAFMGAIAAAERAAFLTVAASLQAIPEAIVASLETIWNAIAHPFRGDYMAPWREWEKNVKERMNAVKDWWDLMKFGFNIAFPGKEELHRQTMEEEAQLLVAMSDKTREYNEMRAAGSVEEAKAAGKQLDDLKTQYKALVERRLAEQDALKMSKAQREEEAAKLEIRRKQIEGEKLLTLVSEARAKAQFSYPPEGGEVGIQFQHSLTEVNNLLAAYIKVGNPANVVTKEIVRNFREAGNQAKTITDLERLRKVAEAIGQVKGMPPEVAVQTRQIIAEAAIQVRNTRQHETAAADAERTAALKNAEKQLGDNLDEQLALLKAAHEKQSALDKDQYDNGLQGIDEYYDKRRTIIQSENAKELEIAQHNLDAIEAEQKLRVARTPQQIAELETARAAAAARVTEVEAKAGVSESAEDLARRGAHRSLDKQILDIQQQIAASYGNEQEAADVINEKYNQQVKTLHAKNDAHAIAVLNQQREIDLVKSALQFRQQDLDLWMAKLQLQKDAQALDQAMIDAAKARIQGSEDKGNITPVEAMRRRNALAMWQIEHDRQILYIANAELSRKTLEYDAQRLIIVKEMEKLGKEEDSAETLNRINKELEPLRSQIVGLKGEIMKTDSAIQSAFEHLESYGNELKKVFQDSLAQMLTDLTTMTGKAQDVVKTFLKSLENQIVGTVMKNIASKITDALSKIGSHIDVNTGKPTGGIFDKIFSALGLSSAPDGTKEHPLNVFVIGGATSTLRPPPPMKVDLTISGNLASAFAGSPIAGIGQLVMGVLGKFLTGGGGGGGGLNLSTMPGYYGNVSVLGIPHAEGGLISGPGTGTSDSIPAMLSAGEHVMPASKAAQWMPLLEGIRLGKLAPAFALGGVVAVQSIAIPSVIPRRYAGGGMVVSDAGASGVQTGSTGPSHLVVSLHPDAMNMTLREWLEHEVVRQHGRR